MRMAAIIYENTCIYWYQLMALLGVLMAFCLSLAIVRSKGGGRALMSVLLVLTAVFSLYISRFFHWYFVVEAYPSLAAALTDFKAGGYCISGIIPGFLLGAAITGLINRGMVPGLKDAAMPGLLFFMAFLRLAEHFAGTCTGSVNVTWKAFQGLPFAVPVTDAAGNTAFRFATAPMSFLLYFLAGIFSLAIFFFSSGAAGEDNDGPGPGYTAALSLAIGAIIEILMDSTRNDAVMIQFRLLEGINKYVGFVSIGMIIPAAALITVFVRYLRAASEEEISTFAKVGTTILFFLGVIIISASEYLGQRYTSLTLLFRMLQTVGGLCAVSGILVLHLKIFSLYSLGQKF